MPRAGLAYQLNSRTVLRSGFGMFAGFLGERRGDVFQNGFTQNTNMVLTTNNGLNFLTTLANPFPNGVSEARGAADGLQTYLGQGFTYFNQNPKLPVTMRWEIGIQNQFKGFLVETNYVGSKTNHIEITRNINTLPSFHRKLIGVTDGTSNTIMVGTKALATQVYNNRGSGNFTMSNGTTRGTYDDPITMADIWADTGMGICRAQNQDTVFWIGGTAASPIPGTRFGMNSGWLSWFPSTFQFVQDIPDLDAYNRWGSPYPGGSPTAT